jgi:serine/threonine-protein kinase
MAVAVRAGILQVEAGEKRARTGPAGGAPAPAPVIRILGRYELVEMVGSGGMAAVYRARDTALDREVAVKLLHPHLASAAESRARFAREARAVARLAHPSILEIYDYSGDGAPEAYLVTEFVRGPTLRSFAQTVGFGAPEIAMLAGRALADALVHAHSAGVIHRDLKPENVLLRGGDQPALKLADFGIARILASDERMTMTGALVGSPHHMAPEIVEGREADTRSDIFSLGTLLYWLATGRLPFAASGPTAILRRVLEGDFEDSRAAEPRVPDALAELLDRCLSVDPARRPQTAAEVRDALDRILLEVGIDRPAEELLTFLRDPAAYQAAFPPRAVAALGALADEAAAAGASARALRHYSRVLAIDPGNREVPAKIARLARRARARRAAAMAGVIALSMAALAGVAGALLWARASRPPPPPGPAVAPPVAEAPVDAAAPAEEPARTAGPPIGSSPAPRRSGAGPRPPTPGGTVLSVLVRPYAQRALLDGVEVAREEQNVSFSLGPGRHLVQIEHACCEPFVRRLTADEAKQMGELRVSLEPRPARVRVEGEPATRVYAQGRLLGTAGESQRAPFQVPVPSGGDSPYEAQVQIRLEPPSAAPRTMAVRLRAGTDVVVAAPQTETAP